MRTWHWQSLASWAREPNPEAGVLKTVLAEAQATDMPRQFRLVISDGSVDRERDVIEPAGWDLASYRRNPIVLFAHDYRELPIARDAMTVLEDSRLYGHPVFPERGVYPFADTVHDLLAGGFLNAASVGFRPLEHAYDEERRGYNVLRAELLEWSIVPVPANPQALVEARGKGIDARPLREWAERILDGEHGPGFWVSRATMEQVWKVTAPVAQWATRPVASENQPGEVKIGDLSVTVNPQEADAAHDAIKGMIAKAGRVLSAANEQSLRDALGDATNCVGRIQMVLDKLPAMPDDDDEHPMMDDDDDKALRFEFEDDPGEHILELEDDDVDELDPAVIRAELTKAVGEEVRAALLRVTGRLD